MTETPTFKTYTISQPDIEKILQDTYTFSLKDFKNFVELGRINAEIIMNYIIEHTKIGDLHSVIHLIFKYYNNLYAKNISKDQEITKKITTTMNTILHASIKIQSRSHRIIPEKELLRLY